MESHRLPARRAAFTLTELLVVIAIIAILASLATVGVMQAMGTAKQTRIKLELDQIDTALKDYKNKYGAYPPCRFHLDLNGLRQHVAMAFPRYNLGDLDQDIRAALGGPQMGNGLPGETFEFRPDQALVFWLRGFGPDPQHPFLTVNDEQINAGTFNPGQKVQRTSLFTFDTTRLVKVRNDGTVYDPGDATAPNIVPSYFPAGVKLDGTGAPYVYFDASVYKNLPPMPDDPGSMASGSRVLFNSSNAALKGKEIYKGAGTGTPYLRDLNNNNVVDMNETWINPDTFQLIASGVDGKLGMNNAPDKSKARLYPTGAGYDTSADLADDDNVTNFSTKSRLGDDKP